MRLASLHFNQCTTGKSEFVKLRIEVLKLSLDVVALEHEFISVQTELLTHSLFQVKQRVLLAHLQLEGEDVCVGIVDWVVEDQIQPVLLLSKFYVPLESVELLLRICFFHIENSAMI